MSDAAFLPRARRNHLGLTPRQEHRFNLLAAALISVTVLGWAVAIADQYLRRPDPDDTAPTPARALASKLTDPRVRETAYLDDAPLDFLDSLRGRSGKLKVALRAPGDTLTSPKETPAPELSARFEAPSGRETVSEDFTAPKSPGVYKLAVEMDKATRPIDDLRVITLVPFAEKKKDRIGLY